MAIEYELRVQGDLLWVTARGKDDHVEQVKQYGMAVAAAAIANACHRILCDERQLTYSLGTFDTFDAARHIAENVSHFLKVAIVCGQSQSEDAEFWETVAVNRGLCVRVFRQLDRAQAWL